MSRHIDFKSVLIGGLCVLAGLCLLGAMPVFSTGSHGRFQLETNKSHAFVLDSDTGQAWSLYTGNDAEVYPPEFDPNAFYAPKLDGVSPTPVR